MNKFIKTTPNKIEKLRRNQIFVFGSNTFGNHSGGAAMKALEFGAIMGNPVGIQGNTYAIPTVILGGKRMKLRHIKREVKKFIKYAKANPRKQFLVTEIGCGIAGFTPLDIAPMFTKALNIPNIILPYTFINTILTKHNNPIKEFFFKRY